MKHSREHTVSVLSVDSASMSASKRQPKSAGTDHPEGYTIENDSMTKENRASEHYTTDNTI